MGTTLNDKMINYRCFLLFSRTQYRFERAREEKVYNQMMSRKMKEKELHSVSEGVLPSEIKER